MRPLVTALVNSYTRVDFIRQAVLSTIAQVADSDFEIVVINALDEMPYRHELELAAQAKGVSLRLAKVEPGKVGPGLLRGLRESEGEVISIIDDDDIWEQGKLAAVSSAFRSYPKLCYLHNAQTLVNVDNVPLSPLNLHRLIRHPSSLIPPHVEVLANANNVSDLKKLVGMEAMFNNSSISVRREVLESVESLLPSLSGGEDSFLFFAALGHGGQLMATSNRLTRLRVHSAGTTSAGRSIDSFHGRLLAYTEFVERHLHRLDLCEEALGAGASRAVRLLLERDRAEWMLMREMTGTGLSPGELAGATRSLFASARFGVTTRNLMAIALGWTAAASPALARSMFLSWRLAW